MRVLTDKKLFILILVLAFALRVWNFNFDADTSKPLSYDFLAKIKEIENVAFEKQYEPASFKQPYFLIYTSAFVFKMLKVFGAEDKEIFREALVLYMILYSLLTIFVLYLIGKEVFNKKVALLASLILAVVPVNVIGSRYFKEDMPLMFFTNLALLFMVLLFKTKKKYCYFWTAFAVGAAIATKYSAFLILPIFFLIHLLFVNKFQKEKLFNKELFVSFSIIILVFLVINPYIILKWKDFGEGLLYQVQYSQTGHHDKTAISPWDYGWGFYFLYAIIPGASLLIALSFVGGAAITVLKRKNRLALLLLVFAALYYLVFEYSKAKPFPFFARYLHPLFPVISLFAAYFLYKFYTRSKNNIWRFWTGFLIAVIILIPFIKSFFITKEIKNDTRFVATSWINENFPKNSKIYLDDKYYSPRPREGKFEVKSLKPLTDFPFENYKRKKVDYVILNSFRYERYWMAAKSSSTAKKGKEYYERIFNEFELIEEFRPPYKFQTYGFHNPVIKIYKVH